MMGENNMIALANDHAGLPLKEEIKKLLDSMGLTYKDFGSYSMAQRRLDADYHDKEKWTRMAITNTAKAGFFSSDRTIQEYNDKIWHLEKLD